MVEVDGDRLGCHRRHQAGDAQRGCGGGGRRAALAAGNRKAADVLSRLEVAWLDGEDPSLFTNLNTLAEYHAFLAGMRKTR